MYIMYHVYYMYNLIIIHVIYKLDLFLRRGYGGEVLFIRSSIVCQVLLQQMLFCSHT